MIVDTQLEEALAKVRPLRIHRLFFTQGSKKTIRQKLEILLKKYKCTPHFAYQRAIGNAIKHGRFPIKCYLYMGRNQYLIRIKDSGKGFDYVKTLQKYKNGEKYWNNKGTGFRHYMEKGFIVSFRKGGRETFILYDK